MQLLCGVGTATCKLTYLADSMSHLTVAGSSDGVVSALSCSLYEHVKHVLLSLGANTFETLCAVVDAGDLTLSSLEANGVPRGHALNFLDKLAFERNTNPTLKPTPRKPRFPCCCCY